MNRTQEKVRPRAAPGRCLYNRQDGDGDAWWFMKGAGDLYSTEGKNVKLFWPASGRSEIQVLFRQAERGQEQM